MKPPSKSAYNTIASEEDSHEIKYESTKSGPILVKDTDNHITVAAGETWTKGEFQPLAYRDKKFAIAFWVHMLLLIFSASFAPSAIRDIVHNVQETTHRNERTRYLKPLNDPSIIMDEPKRMVSVDNSTREDVRIVEFNTSATVIQEITFSHEEPGCQINATGQPEEYYSGYFSYRLDSDHDGDFHLRRAWKFSCFMVLASLAISLCFTFLALFYLQHHAERIIKGSLFFIIVYFAIKGIHALLSPGMPAIHSFEGQGREMIRKADEDGKYAIAMIDFFLSIFFACYARAFWANIPFSASTLRTGVTACKMNLGVFTFAFFTPLLNIIMFVIQTMALITILNILGAFEGSPTDNVTYTIICFVLVLFLISVFWTWQVTKNISTVIVSGTVGTWWFTPVDASSFCSSAVNGSIKRALTYSFGSICFGSLIVTILNVFIDGLRRLRQSRQCLLLFCVVQCILEVLERLAEYFNKWAMVYVGLYGYDFLTAGKNVVTLFRARGWSSIISNNLVNRALMVVATVISLATGLIISMVWHLFEIGESDTQVVKLLSFIYFYAAFVISLLNANFLLSVVGAASDTAIVCFAEGSPEFEMNHPQLSAMMHESYAQAWPEVDFRRDLA